MGEDCGSKRMDVHLPQNSLQYIMCCVLPFEQNRKEFIMKKFLAMTAALVLTMSLAACGNTEDSSSSKEKKTTTTTAAPADDSAEVSAAEGDDGGEAAAPAESAAEEVPAVEAEAITATPLVYLGFEDTTGLKAVEQTEDVTGLTGANFGIGASSHEIMIAEGQGAVGNSLYIDGKYGVDFDMPEIDDDSYTISFWFNADRVATYGPVVQMGRNIGMASTPSEPVTWINFTKTDWGTDSAAIFPVAWNRNSSIGTEVAADGVWPWIYAMDDMEHGKREWCMVTVVADGKRYTADDGMERIQTKFYINGELMWDANAENMYYQGLSPEIFAGEGNEGHIGINYWDTVYKGFIDELYIYDDALTDGMVKGLFEQGNPPASPVAPALTAAE